MEKLKEIRKARKATDKDGEKQDGDEQDESDDYSSEDLSGSDESDESENEQSGEEDEEGKPIRKPIDRLKKLTINQRNQKKARKEKNQAFIEKAKQRKYEKQYDKV